MSGPSLNLSFTPKDQIVRAGAGAGKTYNLVECVYGNYRHFIDHEKRTPRFVMTTFTRKATHELRERMVLKACRTKDQDFFNFVTDPSRLHISTIHGVLTQFLREFGHLHGLDISLQVLEETQESELAQGCVRKMLVEDSDAVRWLDDIPIYQLSAMLRTYSEKVGYNSKLQAVSVADLIQHGEEKFRAIFEDFLEFTQQGLETIEDPAYSEYLLGLMGTLNERKGQKVMPFEILSPPRKAKRDSFPVEYHEQMQERIKKIRSLFENYVWDEDILLSVQERWEEFQELGLKFSQCLRDEKIQRGQLAMSDLEALSFQILEQSPFLGTLFSENYDFWLIDEFQDTSELQLKILNHLIGTRPRFVVGDPQQSIYLFRGAQAELFESEMKRIASAQGRVSFLETNFRSQSALLDVINRVMTTKPQFSPMRPHLESAKSSNFVVRIRGLDLEDELRGVAQRILELSEGGTQFDGLCILGRTHDDLFQVASYLKSLNFPTHVHSPSGFWSRHEIKDALSLLKFLINPHDNLNLLQVLRSPWLKVSDEKLKNWMSDEPLSLWNKIKTLVELPAVEMLKRAEGDAQELGVSAAFIKLLNACDFIAWNLKNDPAGRVEANIWKLISKIKEQERKPGAHLFDLFNEHGEESDAVAATEPNCINLMTIHGSKGLEFNHVLIPRAGRRRRPSTRGYISFSEDGSQFTFSIKDEEGESLSTTLEREWIEELNRREALEAERWLYVALTRAKKTFTVSWNQDEIHVDSWVGHFNLELGEWPEGRLREGPFPEPIKLEARSVRELALKPFAENLMALTKKRSSFSQIKSSQGDSFQRARILNLFKSQALGVDWHRRFESLKYGGSMENSKEMEFLASLKDPPFLEILKSGQVEWGFQSRVHDRILEGQVDLWGYDSKGDLWVVDYKTGSSGSLETARLQTHFYAWILRRRELKAKTFRWAVIYPIERKTVTGEVSPEDFKKLELELGLTERAGQ